MAPVVRATRAPVETVSAPYASYVSLSSLALLRRTLQHSEFHSSVLTVRHFVSRLENSKPFATVAVDSASKS